MRTRCCDVPVTLALNAVLRRGERRRHRQAAARPLDGVDHRRRVCRQHVDQLQRPGGELERAARPRSPGSLAPPTPSTGSGGGASGSVRAQLRHQVGAGDSVDAGVVHLGHHRQPAALRARRCPPRPRSPTSPTAAGCGPAVTMRCGRRSRRARRGHQAAADRSGADAGSTSKSSSSTHTGWSRLKRLSASFSRNSGMALMRSASASRNRSKV